MGFRWCFLDDVCIILLGGSGLSGILSFIHVFLSFGSCKFLCVFSPRFTISPMLHASVRSRVRKDDCLSRISSQPTLGTGPFCCIDSGNEW